MINLPEWSVLLCFTASASASAYHYYYTLYSIQLLLLLWFVVCLRCILICHSQNVIPKSRQIQNEHTNHIKVKSSFGEWMFWKLSNQRKVYDRALCSTNSTEFKMTWLTNWIDHRKCWEANEKEKNLVQWYAQAFLHPKISIMTFDTWLKCANSHVMYKQPKSIICIWICLCLPGRPFLFES